MRTHRCLLLAVRSFQPSAPRATTRGQPFEPKPGQAGKDVVWVPSPPDMVNKMMEIGQVTSKDFVIDLGSGDGRNVIAAAKLGAQALGVEYNPDMVALSRKLAQEAGVADKAQFVEADMYEYDISKATVMALFLLPVNMNRLAPKFFNLAPGSRIVANTFGIDGWEPDVRVTLPPASRVRELVRGAVVDRAREGRRHVGDAERLADADAGVSGRAGHDHDRRRRRRRS